jgi:hypothetical protein
MVSKSSVTLEKRVNMKIGMETIIENVSVLIEQRQINAVIGIHDQFWSPDNREMARSIIDTIKAALVLILMPKLSSPS